MTNDELSAVALKLFNPLPGEGVAVGSPRHFGSRIQPNSPGDDEEEILFSILEGLAYGCGDVIIGLNPASDDVETIVRLEELLGTVVERLELPTRYCVLSDIVKQSSARARVRVDVGFQSLAGTSKALGGMVGLRRRRRARPCARLRRPLLRDGAGFGGDERRGRGRGHGDARSAQLRRGAAHRAADGRVDDRQRRGGLYRAGGLPHGRAAPARVPRRHRHGQAARPDDGARRLFDLPHGHRAGGAAAADGARSSSAPRPPT